MNGLDPELIQLFDADKAPATEADAFVASVLLSMQRTRRLRLIRQIAGLAIILICSAFLAPYVAQQTLFVADWIANQLLIGSVCAALLAWRITRWARNY